jgi:general secretion pathway protein D
MMPRKRLDLLGVSAAIALSLSCGGGSSIAFREGRRAEARKDWDTALVDYQKAVQTDPANASYIIHERAARTQASLFHLKNGQRLVKDGRTDDAAGEFQKAVGIDPSNEAARQELSRIVSKQAEAKRAREIAIQQALKTHEEAAQTSAIQLKALPPEPLGHFRINADSRKIFETLGQLAGVNVAFTQDFRGGPLNLDLSNIKIEDALKVLTLQTKTFWKAITPNTILIIPDSPNNRRDYEDEVVRTVYLANPLAPADRTAITTALKQVLMLQHIMDNPDSNAIVIRDTPAKVAAAEQLIRELDRAKAEILIDINVIEADRDRIRNLGLTPASISSSGTVSPGLQVGAAFAPTTTVSGTTTAALSTAINALSGPGQIFKDYAVVLPSAEATAVLNDSKTHILQNPEVRVTDGQTAKVKIGTRIPIATGSFLPSLGGTTTSSSGSVGLLASTQFQYQDVGVNLELTPRLLATGEVALHAHIEISSLGASISVGGFSQPTFSQRVIEHDIRLREGEVNVLGGLIQSTVTNTVNGIPGLADIPFLHYFFSDENKEVNDQEVMVMLTPRVIRLPEPAVTVGTGFPAGTAGGGGRSGVSDVPQPAEVPLEPAQPPQ